MEIRTDTVISHPREVVYETYRDRLVDLVPYIPNIESITVLESRREGTKLFLVNEWHATGKIPRVARPYVNHDMLRWKDHADWHDEDWCVHWRFEMAFLSDIVQASGINSFFEEGPGSTRIALRGDLQIDGSKLPGIPSRLGRKAAPHMEKFCIALVQPNLVKTTTMLQRLLDDESRTPDPGT